MRLRGCYCYSVVCLYVCLLITNVSCAKTAEPIEIPFGIWARVGPGIRVLTGGFGSTTGNGTFGGYISACPNLTAVDILNVVRCAAAFGYQSVYCSNLFYTILRTFRCAEDESADVRLAGAGFDGDLHLVVRQWSQTVEPIGRYGPIVIVVNHDHRSPNLQRFFLVRVHLSAHGQQFNRRMKACSQLQSFANSSVNGRIRVHALRTNRALTVLLWLQPVNTMYSRDA